MDDPKNHMVRMFAMGKVTKLMRKYEEEGAIHESDENTKRLLKGFYTSNKNELEGDKEDALERYGFKINKDEASRIVDQFRKQKKQVEEKRNDIIVKNTWRAQQIEKLDEDVLAEQEKAEESALEEATKKALEDSELNAK